MTGTHPRPLRYRGRLNRRGRKLARRFAPIVIRAVLDDASCPGCQARHGKIAASLDGIDNPNCTNDNGCRCVGVRTIRVPRGSAPSDDHGAPITAVDITFGPAVRGSGPVLVLDTGSEPRR